MTLKLPMLTLLEGWNPEYLTFAREVHRQCCRVLKKGVSACSNPCSILSGVPAKALLASGPRRTTTSTLLPRRYFLTELMYLPRPKSHLWPGAGPLV